MYINYLTLALATAASALTLGAVYLLGAPAAGDAQGRRRGFAWAFGAAGLLLLITGLHLVLTWPIPGGYNIVFGEPLAYFGTLLVIGAPALWLGERLGPLLLLGAAGGVINLVLAWALLRHGMTQNPALAAAMYAASGLGLLIAPAMDRSALARRAAGALFAASAALFALFGLAAYLKHPAVESFGKWVPIEMRSWR
ncbi:uncharacterized protein SOCEGT47_074230 [Sorangium cellulosum]|uniref:DUF981 family protein n=2 Tax=Sorangium cellulosum TaxID=56 RepID=A0A4P2QCJ9_SORCE|nr:uncharacterized protein SOCEGT47_074230 [Sorangium cellulosum]